MCQSPDDLVDGRGDVRDRQPGRRPSRKIGRGAKSGRSNFVIVDGHDDMPQDHATSLFRGGGARPWGLSRIRRSLRDRHMGIYPHGVAWRRP
jgi:hypothetical protein